MSPLILASQSQALPLLFLSLAMATGHPDAGLKKVHAAAHVHTVASAPMLYPGNASTCSAGSRGRYDVIIDPRLELNATRDPRKPD